MRLYAAAFTVAALAAGPAAFAQDNPPATSQKADPAPKPDNKLRDTANKAGDIATQPVRDVGVSKKEIPAVLQRAKDNPYSRTDTKTCKQIASAISDLNEELGPDFVVAQVKKENRAGKLAEAGGKTIVNTFIPFRALVREISGAAPAERRLTDAVDAGYARRGYLRGVQSARGCKII